MSLIDNPNVVVVDLVHFDRSGDLGPGGDIHVERSVQVYRHLKRVFLLFVPRGVDRGDYDDLKVPQFLRGSTQSGVRETAGVDFSHQAGEGEVVSAALKDPMIFLRVQAEDVIDEKLCVVEF